MYLVLRLYTWVSCPPPFAFSVVLVFVARLVACPGSCCLACRLALLVGSLPRCVWLLLLFASRLCLRPFLQVLFNRTELSHNFATSFDEVSDIHADIPKGLPSLYGRSNASGALLSFD